LGAHARWLFALGIIGAIIEGLVFFYGNSELPIVAFFSLFVSFWAYLFTEFWKREENTLSLMVSNSL
jgi:hypothetical protein